MKRILLGLLLATVSIFANAQGTYSVPFNPYSKTITFTANVSGSIPTPVMAPSNAGTATQYLISNTGVNLAFISYSPTSAGATTNCVVPTGTATATVPSLPGTQIIITTGPNAYFCGITGSGTSIIYVTSGYGQ